MNYQLKIIAILSLLLTGYFSYGQKSEKKLVQQSFDNYKNAILNDKGEEAINYVDSRTIKYYSDVLELVKTADSATIEKLSIFDKLMVFTIKHRTDKKDILSFDGKSLLIYSIKSGMVGKNGVAKNEIGDIIIEDDFAKGQLIANGQAAPFYFHFYKEDGQWKIDLTSLFPISNMAFQKLIDESGENPNNYIFKILEIISGKQPTAEIWQPIQ